MFKIGNILPRLYVLWMVVVLVLILLKDKFSHDNVTHIAIAIILLLSLYLLKRLTPRNPKRFFVFWGVVLAALVEGAYMITKPVLPSLLVDKDTSAGLMLQNYLIDLVLTLPVYVVIFLVIWWLINKYNYKKWEYIFLIALGQSLGDGSSFFLLAPGALIFLPYVMLNYHAMNVAPYLSIQSFLNNKIRSDSFWKYPAAILYILLVYLVGGTIIKVIGNAIFPQS